MKYALGWDEYTKLLRPVLQEGRRPLLASFMGSNWTCVLRPHSLTPKKNLAAPKGR
jgi:hypothetical protein